MNLRKVTVGADPEVFLSKNGVPVPAIGLIGGTKHDPLRWGIGAVQEDNVMAEFNIPPASTAEEFDEYIGSMLGEVRTIASRQGLDVAVVPYARFPFSELQHPQAMTMGCEPDYCAWTNRRNPPIYANNLDGLRVAAGHVHVGIEGVNEFKANYRTKLVCSLDLHLGVPSMLIDKDVTRRKFYGMAGSYRPKPYGIEYRVLSNFWITDSKYRQWVFHRVMEAVERAERYDNYFRDRLFIQTIRKAINEGQEELIKQLIRKFDLHTLE